MPKKVRPAGDYWLLKVRTLKVNEEHREGTGFSVPFGHYEFNSLPFGLSNSRANFQRLMDTVLKDLIGSECYVFFDDIAVF